MQEFLVGNLSGPGYWQLKAKEYMLQRTEAEIKKLTHRVILIKNFRTASANQKLGYLAKLITNFVPLFTQEQVEEVTGSGKKLEYWHQSSVKKILDLKIKRGVYHAEAKEMAQRLYGNTQIVERDGLEKICEAWFEYKREKKSAGEVLDELHGANRRVTALDSDSDDADKISGNP